MGEIVMDPDIVSEREARLVGTLSGLSGAAQLPPAPEPEEDLYYFDDEDWDAQEPEALEPEREDTDDENE